MIKCSKECTPCCDFCIYAVHELLEDEDLGGTIYGGPIHCELHPDEEHDKTCESCSYCEDFHCFRADLVYETITEENKRAKRRHRDFKKAIRKRNITRSWHWPEEYYSNLHQFSKNKIHCSYPLCSNKTNNKHNPGWNPTMNWPTKDKKRIEEMKDQVSEEWLENSQD